MMTFSILARFLVGCVGLLPQSEAQTGQSAKIVVEVRTGSLPAVIVLGGMNFPTNAVALSSDGKLIACGGEDAHVRIFDETGRLITFFGGHSAPIRAVAFSPDGAQIASAGAGVLVADGPVFIPVGTSLPIPVELAERPVNKGHGFPPIVGDGRVRPRGRSCLVSDVQTGEVRRAMGGSTLPPIDSVYFSSDNSSLAMFGGEFQLEIVKLAVGSRKHTILSEGIERDHGSVLGVVTSMSGDTQRLVSVALAKQPLGTIKLWEVTGSRFRDLDPKGVHTSCAMRLDGKRFLIGSQNGSVSEWDFDKGELIRTFDKRSTGTRPVEFLAYSPDGKQIVSGDEAGVVRLYDADKAALLHTRQGPGRPVRAAAFLPSRVKIACGGHYLRTDPKLPQAERYTAEPILVWQMGRD